MIPAIYDPRKPIEEIVEREYTIGVSPLAALRQMCRSLDGYPKLKRLFEDILIADNQEAQRFTSMRNDFREVLKTIEKH